MTDAWTPQPEPPAERSRLGCALAMVGLFLVGFVGTGAVLFLRAPDHPGTPAEPPLAHLLVEPDGYRRLPDASSGGGRVSAAAAATLLGAPEVPGFRDGVLRAWGRAPGEPPRAVVVLLVELDSPERALATRRAYAAALRPRGATPFATPTSLAADGLLEGRDPSGRFTQRVVVARGTRLYVVSVVTPAADEDTAEVVALATRQAAAG